VLLPLALALIAYGLWRGTSPLGVGLMTLGFLLHLWGTLRLARATTDPVGGHAEWVRERSTRPRLAASPAWAAGVVLLVAGLALVLWTSPGGVPRP